MEKKRVETQELRKAGLKVTLPRVKILEIREGKNNNPNLGEEQV